MEFVILIMILLIILFIINNHFIATKLHTNNDEKSFDQEYNKLYKI